MQIDYKNRITVQNSTAIEQLIQSNIDLKQIINQTQTQINDNNAQIAQLKVFNTYITAIIGTLTDPAVIAYQNSIATLNTASIMQLSQLTENLVQSIMQLQIVISNNLTQISVLQTQNTYIIDTIDLIPIS